MDTTELLRLLLEPSRLAVVGSVALEARSSDEVAAALGLESSEVLRILGPLVQAGLVATDGATYRLDTGRWRGMAQQLPQAPPPHARIAFGMTRDEAGILGRFFSGERLTEIPAQRTKRLVVLERLALEFEPGRRYDEAEVNAVLGRFHPDHATLRRELVDEGLLDREDGVYWRSGGRVAL